jgi:hypothetical protein
VPFDNLYDGTMCSLDGTGNAGLSMLILRPKMQRICPDRGATIFDALGIDLKFSLGCLSLN